LVFFVLWMNREPMVKRIIPISSGKGGVGKTSFAVNLALLLSKFGKCILVDLDTGTSSIRKTIHAPVRRDLYHFFKKNEPLSRCITPLDDRLDPAGVFSRFGFIASPRHMIESIVNMDQAARNHLIDAINGLDADFIILDLKAGLDPGVIDFMPHSNTGILVFTPHHPAATLAASDIAKAILFRELRELFHAGSALYQHFPGVNPCEINQLIDLTEDVYEPEPANLDNFLALLKARLPRHPFVQILRSIVHRFRVYYVLNRFDGVDDSYETAVKPLVDNISRNISAGLKIGNLGWVIESDAYHKTNMKQVPYIIGGGGPVKVKKKDVVAGHMEALYELAGIRKKPETPQAPLQATEPPAVESLLDGQLRAIQGLYAAKSGESVMQNFDYIVSSLRYLFKNKRLSEFGTGRLLKKGELVPRLIAQKLRRDAALRNQ